MSTFVSLECVRSISAVEGNLCGRTKGFEGLHNLTLPQNDPREILGTVEDHISNIIFLSLLQSDKR